MKTRLLCAFVVAVALSAALFGQDAGSPPPDGQNSRENPDSGNGGGYGQHGGRGGGMGMMGRGLMGTVTEVPPTTTPSRPTPANVYTVHFSADTRIVKQRPACADPAAGVGAMARAEAAARVEAGVTVSAAARQQSPAAAQATDIKVGDAIAAMGETRCRPPNPSSATAIVQIDPERAKQMREMQANFGKTWLHGQSHGHRRHQDHAHRHVSTTPPTPLSPTKTPPSASAATPSPWPISRWATRCASKAPSRMESLPRPA